MHFLKSKQLLKLSVEGQILCAHMVPGEVSQRICALLSAWPLAGFRQERWTYAVQSGEHIQPWNAHTWDTLALKSKREMSNEFQRLWDSYGASHSYKDSGVLYPLKYLCFLDLILSLLKMFAAHLGEGTHIFAKMKQKLEKGKKEKENFLQEMLEKSVQLFSCK